MRYIRNLSNREKVKELIDNNQNKIKFYNTSIPFGETDDIDLNKFFSKICIEFYHYQDDEADFSSSVYFLPEKKAFIN
jgi:hypothetical protein